jgi:hypothetical protein
MKNRAAILFSACELLIELMEEYSFNQKNNLTPKQ